jgi:hypothetical protein
VVTRNGAASNGPRSSTIAEVSAPSIGSVSSPQISSADTSPPSWPAACTPASVARVSRIDRAMPYDLVGGALAAEQLAVEVGLPVAEPRARARADVAATVADGALVVGHALADLDREVVVGVAEHVLRARHHAGGTPGAQARVHDLVVQLAPVDVAHRWPLAWWWRRR